MFGFSYNLLTRYGSDGTTPVIQVIAYYVPCVGIQNCRVLESVDVSATSDLAHYVAVFASGDIVIGEHQTIAQRRHVM